MRSRKDGSFTYRRTEADDEFNKREEFLASIAGMPGAVAVRAVFNTELVEQAKALGSTSEVTIEIDDQLLNAG